VQITAVMKALGKQRKSLSKEEFAAKSEEAKATVAGAKAKKVELDEAIPGVIAELEVTRKQVAAELSKMGNFLDPSVPVSNDEVRLLAPHGALEVLLQFNVSDACCVVRFFFFFFCVGTSGEGQRLH